MVKTKMDYSKLISSSDIRGNAERDLNKEFIKRFSFVLSEYLKKNNASPLVVIGKDSRISSPRIEDYLAQYLSRSGIDVIRLRSGDEWDDVSTTPIVFKSIIHYKADAGIMVTASHLPSEWNGLKIFTGLDVLPKKELKNLLVEAGLSNPKFSEKKSTVKDEFYIDTYCDDIIKMIREGISSNINYERPLAGMNILVDSGNGATGFFASKILQPLGANTAGSLYLEPDGNFPNHIPNPEQPDALKDLCAAVIDTDADLGIIFDTDGDRSSVVLSDGKPVIQNRLLALVSSMVLEENPGSHIVTDSVTSDGLTDFIQKAGGIHRRFRRGYAKVRNEMKALNEGALNEGQVICHVGGETSGHIMFTDNYYADDGSYTIARLLIFLAKAKARGTTLKNILDELDEPAESNSYRLEINKEDFVEYGKSAISSIIQWAEKKEFKIDTTEGVRVNIENDNTKGWFLVRLSLHEPLLVVNMESLLPGGISKMSSLLKENFVGFPDISTDKLP